MRSNINYELDATAKDQTENNKTLAVEEVDVVEPVVEVVEPVRGRGIGRGIMFSQECLDSLRRSKRSKPSLDYLLENLDI